MSHLPSLSQLFEEYKRNFKKRAEEKKREKLRKARELFIVMLSESREITKESRFVSHDFFMLPWALNLTSLIVTLLLCNLQLV